MGDREFEEMLHRVFGDGNQRDGEAFREALLERCLRIVRAGDADGNSAGRELGDSELELLAAAGDLDALGDRRGCADNGL